MIDVSLYSDILNEMKDNKCEHLLYSSYLNGDYHEHMFKGIKKGVPIHWTGLLDWLNQQNFFLVAKHLTEN